MGKQKKNAIILCHILLVSALISNQALIWTFTRNCWFKGASPGKWEIYHLLNQLKVSQEWTANFCIKLELFHHPEDPTLALLYLRYSSSSFYLSSVASNFIFSPLSHASTPHLYSEFLHFIQNFQHTHLHQTAHIRVLYCSLVSKGRLLYCQKAWFSPNDGDHLL